MKRGGRGGLLFSLSCIALFTACAATGPRPPVDDPEARWQERRERLAQQSEWRLNGHVAIRLGDEGWHASLRWRQEGERFAIELFDPLGRRAARIEGDERTASLTTRDGETARAANAERLMIDLLGWGVPIEGARYWVLGVPHPAGGSPQFSLDSQGRLEGLQQAGWTIDYQEYREVSQTELPRKLRMENRGLSVKLVVDEWELSAADGKTVAE